MSKKHYEQLAKILKSGRAGHTPPIVAERIGKMANEIADMLAADNSRFDRERFLNAAGVN